MAFPRTSEPSTRSDAAYRFVVEFIEGGGTRDDGRLPSEAELGERLGLSRTSVREALARARAEGRIVSRRGSGTFAVRTPPAELVRLSPIESVRGLLDWHELRVAIESEAVAHAAERRSDAEVEVLRRIQAELVAKLDAGEWGEREDFAFHQALASGSRNAKLIEALGALNTHIFHWIDEVRDREILSPSERREIIVMEHSEIIEAVAQRNPDRARAALRRHLLNGRARILGAASAR
jgi:GntR family transcriptional regulator, transcriptional repressor for pyruvate dehydrogenase complex